MIITHTRKSSTSNKTLFFNVTDGVITRIFENGHKEVVTKNERLVDLTPLPKVEEDPVEITCEKIEIESIQTKEDYSWILKPVETQIKNLLKNNNNVMITGIKIEYETIPQSHHIHIEI